MSGGDDVVGIDAVVPTATVAPTEPTEAPTPTVSTPDTERTVEADPAAATDVWLALWAGVELVVTDPDGAELALGRRSERVRLRAAQHDLQPRR